MSSILIKKYFKGMTLKVLLMEDKQMMSNFILNDSRPNVTKKDNDFKKR